MPGTPLMQGLHANEDDHLSLRVPLSPSSPDRGVLDSNGYSTASEATGCRHHRRGHRGSGEKKQLAPVRLDMPIFKSTDPGVEVTYTLWHFDVDAFLEQYDEASIDPHIFASLRRYPGKWACTLDKGPAGPADAHGEDIQ